MSLVSQSFHEFSRVDTGQDAEVQTEYVCGWACKYINDMHPRVVWVRGGRKSVHALGKAEFQSCPFINFRVEPGKAAVTSPVQ